MNNNSNNVNRPEIPITLPDDAAELLGRAKSVRFFTRIEDVEAAACANDKSMHEVAFDVPGKGRVVEAVVCRVRNGISANYPEPYMRRRDPDCMVIADDRETDKPRYAERFGKPFDSLRKETFDWLATQDLAVFAFWSGRPGKGVASLAICPANAGFFAYGLALLQGIASEEDLGTDFKVGAVIYVAPPFRHTHFKGRQMVVHNRRNGLHELFSYNLYPGPSAKKGVYGVLLNIGEQEGWVTAHCSAVQVVTPYDNVVTFIHEGASGGGKSEMLELVHREPDGLLRLGTNLVTGEKRTLALPRTCELHPVCDDMALCHPNKSAEAQKLVVSDAEDAWFVRVNHITEYGIDPHLEGLTVKSKNLLFLNIDAVPGSTALIWEAIEDAPGKRCPNPRVILPRRIVPGVVSEPVPVDVRSFGVRCPPCTAEKPSYGILGFLHVLPPALAWLWRLVAPRGHNNPSVVGDAGMSSEGVGSYWPFATGRRVDHANLLLKQFVRSSKTRYILCPNQHVGAWEVGFMPQWITREYLARRGSARFRSDQITAARCPLLGYAMHKMQVEGTIIPHWFLEVETQPQVGTAGYDAGAKILTAFFHEQLEQFKEDDLDPLGRKIIDACLANASVSEYESLLPSE